MVDAEEVRNKPDQIGKEVVDPGGAEADNEVLLAEGMEYAMVVSGDEPSLKEVLSRDEREAWMDKIEAELAQMEKVKAWTPVIPPPDANIIPSLFVFCHKQVKLFDTKLDSLSKDLNKNSVLTTLTHSLQLFVHPHFTFYSHLQLKRVPLSTNVISKTHN